MATQIKICGITNIDDAELAIKNGANFLGLIFVPDSPRAITPMVAHSLRRMLPPGTEPQLVGVFKDAPHPQIEEAINTYNLDLVQCHGTEPPVFCAQISRPLIKTIELTPHDPNSKESTESLMHNYVDVATYLLLDRPKEMKEDSTWLGAAVAFIKEIDIPLPYFFAGGLSSGNIPEVMQHLTPFGVDVASGVEASPGKKDPEKLKRFCAAVRWLDGALNK